MYLSPPSPANVPYNLTNTFDGYVPAAMDESEALLLKHKVNNNFKKLKNRFYIVFHSTEGRFFR